MSQSRSQILDNIRRHARAVEPQPDIQGFEGIRYADKVAQFIKITEGVGGKVIEVQQGDDMAQLIRAAYPEAQRFISDLDLPELSPVSPKSLHSAIEMNGTDVTVVASPLGVCENACLWVEQTEEWRAQYFIADYLVVIIDRANLVDNMHEAYRVVQGFAPQTPYSGFISGPSKTADIEQALVMGAHGAKGLTVLLK